jgi:hypoxanthine-DNA glycosylase
MSLKKRQYYGHPQNAFWKIMAKLAGASGSYRSRCGRLKAKGIALWDILGACERQGALDTNIRKSRPNDLEGFITRHKGLRKVCLNGRKAEALYRKHFGEKIPLKAVYLPSTSPAHASVKHDHKLMAWRKALKG